MEWMEDIEKTSKIKINAKNTYVEGNQRWVNLCIYHGIWPRILNIVHPVLQDPTVNLHTRSNKLVMLQTMIGSYEELCLRLDKSKLATSSYRHAVSGKREDDILALLSKYLEDWRTVHAFFSLFLKNIFEI